MITILERNDIFIWTIRSRKTGCVYYEDEAQVFAEPFDDVRLMQEVTNNGKQASVLLCMTSSVTIAAVEVD
jgi:hypothetical protein